VNGETVVAILAALGGASAIGGAVAKIINTWRSWREGVQQREDEADERLVKRLEATIIEQGKEIKTLRSQLNDQGEYILELVMAMARAGLSIPMRRTKGPEEG
jgi:cytochrome c biogenesis protein ResB